jgi:hypothetical protein
VPGYKSVRPPKDARHLPPSGSLCVKDVDLIARQFGKESMRLMSLYQRLNGQPDLLGEHSEQEVRPQSLSTLKRQIYSMLPQPPK